MEGSDEWGWVKGLNEKGNKKEKHRKKRERELQLNFHRAVEVNDNLQYLFFATTVVIETSSCVI